MAPGRLRGTAKERWRQGRWRRAQARWQFMAAAAVVLQRASRPARLWLLVVFSRAENGAGRLATASQQSRCVAHIAQQGRSGA